MKWIKASERLPPKLPKSDSSEYVFVRIGNGVEGWEMKGDDRYDHIGKYWETNHHPPLYVKEWLDEIIPETRNVIDEAIRIVEQERDLYYSKQAHNIALLRAKSLHNNIIQKLKELKP